MYFSFNLNEKFCAIDNTGQLYIFSDEYLNPPKYDLLSVVLLEDLGEWRGWGSMSRSDHPSRSLLVQPGFWLPEKYNLT